jgi:hypothetical protein
MGLNKMGINCSLEQAMCLHSAAKQHDSDPNLSLQEFTEMLFSNDETLSINLKGLKAPSLEEVSAVNEF